MLQFPSMQSQGTSSALAAIEQKHDASAAAFVGQSEKLSLWGRLTTVRINPKNNKCTTLPILKLNNPYSINFHLYVVSILHFPVQI